MVWLSQKIATKNPPYIIENKNGILNSYSDDQLNAIVNDIEKDGYHVFDQKLYDQTIAKITEYVSNLPTIPIPDLGNYKKIVFDHENLVAPRYDFEEIQIIKSAEIQKIIFWRRNYRRCAKIS